MVTFLPAHDRKAIDDAITLAEQRTSVEILIVVARMSDPYLSYLLLYGLVLGTLAASGFYFEGSIRTFPALVIVQYGFMMLVSLVPCIAHWFACLVPAAEKRRRARLRASIEYEHARHHVPGNAPLVMLFVSLGERYAHVHHSRMIDEKHPREWWVARTDAFTRAMKQHGIAPAVTSFVADCDDALAPLLPNAGQSYHNLPNVREI